MRASRNVKRYGDPRLRPAGPMMITRVRPGHARTARVTVLFADLRGYTAFAERLPAVRVVPLLEEFFHVLAGATANFGGEVFHMAGDAMMAGFGMDEDLVRSKEAGFEVHLTKPINLQTLEDTVRRLVKS